MLPIRTVSLEFVLFLFVIVHSEGPPSIIGTVKPLYTVMEGQTLKLWCEVSGIKDPPASRTLTAWKKLPEGRIITDKFPRYKMRLGKYLRIRNVKPEDRGTYVCLASNLHGEITQEIRLVVLESSTTSRTLQITNSSTALYITAKEPGVPSTTNLPTHKGSVRPSSMPPLIVGRPPKFRNPSNRSSEYTQGSPVRLKCHANGEAPLNITWLKDGSILSRADEKLLKSKGRVLNFHKLSSSQAGSYMCIVTNAFGTIVKTFDIKVVGVAPPAEHEPRILKKGLKNETARPGDDATFVCSAISRGYPKFHFLKWKPPENVSNGSDPFDFVDFRKSKFREIREVAKPHMGSRRIYTHRLVIYNVTSADEAKYTCVVGNSAGWVNKHAFLTVDRKGLPLSRKPEASPGERPAATKKPIVSESPSYKELEVEEVPLAALICVPIAVVLLFMVTIVWCYFITRKLHSGKNSKNIHIKFKMVDEATKRTVASIPLLKTKAGPRDSDAWVQRLKEEYTSLIKYVSNNKEADNDWFRLESNKEGTRWFGKCWYIHNLLKYEFDIEFDIPITYPTTAPEIAIPELDGKTAKMYRGGKICMTDHFKPLWARNVPKFGIAHAMALGLGPWLAVEIPDLIDKGMIQYKEKSASN